MPNQDFVDDLAIRIHLFLMAHKVLYMREESLHVGGVEPSGSLPCGN